MNARQAELGEVYATLDSAEQIPVTNEGRTNIVNFLATSGESCRIRGHAWAEHVHVTLEYVKGKIDCRQCKYCGQHQTQFAEWK